LSLHLRNAALILQPYLGKRDGGKRHKERLGVQSALLRCVKFK
jgi:hypothetical protein